MWKTVVLAAGAALLCAPAAMLAQTKAATYITKEEVDVVNKQPGTDRTIRVLDIGHENFAVGIIHRVRGRRARRRGAQRRRGADVRPLAVALRRRSRRARGRKRHRATAAADGLITIPTRVLHVRARHDGPAPDLTAGIRG